MLKSSTKIKKIINLLVKPIKSCCYATGLKNLIFITIKANAIAANSGNKAVRVFSWPVWTSDILLSA
jgi:hypothetical protein